MKVERLSIHAVDLATSEQSENMQERAGKLYATEIGQWRSKVLETHIYGTLEDFFGSYLLFFGVNSGGEMFSQKG